MALKGLLPGPGVQVVDRDLGLVRVEEERLGRHLEGVAPRFGHNTSGCTSTRERTQSAYSILSLPPSYCSVLPGSLPVHILSSRRYASPHTTSKH